MSPGGWAVIIAAVTAVAGWLTFVGRLLWSLRGSIDANNSALAGLRQDVQRLTARDSKIDKKLDTHLSWHAHQGKGPDGR